jgi:hypothetical protein
MTIAERNPCPICKAIPSYMAGINVPGGHAKDTYLVCWTDGMSKRVGGDGEWQKFNAKRQRPEWIKYSIVHWQTTVDGDILDYWPTKSKWRFRGKTQVGNVEKFISDKLRRSA